MTSLTSDKMSVYLIFGQPLSIEDISVYADVSTENIIWVFSKICIQILFFKLQESSVNVEATEAENVYIVSIKTKSINSSRLDLTIKNEKVKPISCLTRISCQICSNFPDCHNSEAEISLFDLIPKTEFGTKIEYQCPLGQEFDVADSNKQTYELECLWNGDWSGSQSLPQCKGKHELLP